MRHDTTILAYHFWSDDGYDEAFSKVAKAFVEAWRHCGELPSVVVVNKRHPCVDEFAKGHPNLEVQEESRLIPGCIFSMSEDCNARLYRRFKTDYVLIIQNDGWPLRDGLDEFVGKWDFVGAPVIRNRWYTRLVARIIGFTRMNGGFSLRSRRCCEAAASYWNEKYSDMGDCEESVEDVFYTEFLVRHEKRYRSDMRFPDLGIAASFSYQFMVPERLSRLPFGFHQLQSLQSLQQNGLVR